jgi:hypothetical protein
MKAIFKSVLMLALISGAASQAMAREFLSSDFSMALTYSNVVTEVFDATVMIWHGKFIYSDDQAYCSLKLENLAPVTCVFDPTHNLGSEFYGTIDLPLDRLVSAARTKPGSPHMTRTLEMLENFNKSVEEKFKTSMVIKMPRSFDPRIQRANALQVHDPKNVTESVHLRLIDVTQKELKSKN